MVQKDLSVPEASKSRSIGLSPRTLMNKVAQAEAGLMKKGFIKLKLN